MENRTGTAGKRGDKVRSDCYVEIELTDNGGLKIDLKSKVELMYGTSIRNFLTELCNFFELKNANVYVEDFGAIEAAMAARFECALKKIKPEEEKEFLPEMHKNNYYTTTKDHFRKSRLYLPGNEPKFYPNAGLHSPDGIILDLEDSVAAAEKDAARYMVRNTLRAIDFYSAERMVRINQLPAGLDDLDFVIPHNVNVILIPKCESAEDIQKVDDRVALLKEKYSLTNDIYFMPIIESAKGTINAYEIASASVNVCSLAVGLEDYTADIGTQRSEEGTESFFMRSMVVNAAKAAGVQAIDTVYSDVSNMDGLRASVLEAKQLGFEGKGCIHPRQIKVIHEAFAPEEKEIEKAKKIVKAYDEATSRGLGVVSLGSKMIDAPVVKRAQKTIEVAVKSNLLSKNWKEEEQGV